MSSKRPRKSTTNSASDESFSGPEQFSPKVKRASLSALSKPVSCSLPPTCNPPHAATICANSREFEQHYGTYHTHICTASEVKRTPTSAREVQCGKVFPDARFLDLHISECHDPLVAVRRDRGERTFPCFVETCDGIFTTPKGRRLHLIDAHKYPKEYCFSVTYKGVGDILNKWGQGASLLRKEWKPREKKNGDAMDIEPKENSPRSSMSSEERAPVTPTDAIKPDIIPSHTSSPGAAQPIRSIVQTDVKAAGPRSDLDDLTSGLSSLTLVPRSIRFGRGGRSGGMIGRGTKPEAAPTPPTAPENGSARAAPSSPTNVLGSGRRPSRGRVAHAFGVVGRNTGTD